MNTMPVQKSSRGNPLIICCVAALSLLLCGRSKLFITASESTDESSKGKKVGLQLSDFFSSIISGDDQKATVTAALPDGSADSLGLGISAEAADQLSEVIKQLQNQGNQQQQKDSSGEHVNKKNRHKGKYNRRKLLYDLSVRAHYGLLHRHGLNGSSPLDNSLAADEDSAISSCDYYNSGMRAKFDLREVAEKDENIFSRSAHWTYKLCPKKSMSQIHLEPSAIKNSDDLTDLESLKLPPSSALSKSIQFLLSAIHNLGTFLPPSTPDYDSLILAAWGPNEAKGPMAAYDRVEYYMGGDLCEGPGVSRNRQSKVLYEKECCERRSSMMEEFFHNDGQIMIQSTSEPEPCKYILRACEICPARKDERNEELDSVAGVTPPVHPSDLGHVVHTFLQYPPAEVHSSGGGAFPPMPPSQIEANKQLLQSMFTHAYDSYFHNAFPASELKPLTCSPGVFDLVKIPALTLIDTLDTLIIMGNYTEFARSVERLRFLDRDMKDKFPASREKLQRGKGKNAIRADEEGGLFSVDQNVSLFETTIRVLGGLLSAHQMAVAFMDNLVPKNEIWNVTGTGEVLSGDNKASVIPEVPFDLRNEGRDGSHNCESTNDDTESDSCLSEPSPFPSDEPCIVDDDEGQGHASVGVAGRKRKRDNSTWEYDGFLLRLAHDIGKRLHYAFDTETGIPYGTVNLLRGIPPGETTVASLAGAGTLSLEFELLSRLTGEESFGKAAKLATRALWIRRSAELNLFGKHIDVKSGKWKEFLSGIGSNSDSFYEYLLKYYSLFPDDADFWTMFVTVYSGVHDNSRLGDWYVDVDMNHGLHGHVRQVFESLMAFYPGMQVLLGEVVPSAKTLNGFFLAREFLGLLPERFNFVHWKTEGSGDIHPLRPELLESCYFLHLASMGLHGSQCGPCTNSSSSPHTSSWLWAADFALHTIQTLSWTPCGYATVKKVGPATTGNINFVEGNGDPQKEQKRLNIQHHNEMPSFFLSETIKYLYLTFDSENNLLHRDSERDWVFTTEAHPIHYSPIYNSTTEGEDRLSTQLSQVRSLLKESIGNRPPSADEEFNATAIAVQQLEREQWAKLTPGSIFAEDIATVGHGIRSSKQAVTLESGPPFAAAFDVSAAHGIFSENLDLNLAYARFERHGKGNGTTLGNRCPNFHHPDLQWTHALHGDLDYHSGHVSYLVDTINEHDGVDKRMLTALASLCFYGTDQYADGIHLDNSESCSIEEVPEHIAGTKAPRAKQSAVQSSAPLPGSTRYDMGGDVGSFDVSAFPNGDGFVVRQVETKELLEVSFFRDDQVPDDTSRMVVLAVLTLPPQTQEPNRSYLASTGTSSLHSRRVSELRHVDRKDKGSSGDEADRQFVDDHHRRHVVVADMAATSFRCEVRITKVAGEDDAANDVADDLLATYPCCPAFFGQSNVNSLVKSGGKIVKGSLSPPPPDDEFGCQSHYGPIPDQDELCHITDGQGHDRSDVQIVRRGVCSFMHKSATHQHAQGVIVMNSDPYELFVMAGDDRSKHGCSLDLPPSVLVSGEDGESITTLLNDEGDVDATILLTANSDPAAYPQVKGSKDALHFLASNGWGVHAVPNPSDENSNNNGWQLFITQHDGQ